MYTDKFMFSPSVVMETKLKYLTMSDADSKTVSPIECEDIKINKLVDAEDEWDIVPVVIPYSSDLAPIVQLESGKKANDLYSISFIEVWNYFRLRDMTEYLEKCKPTLEWKGVSLVLRYLCGPPSLQNSLVFDRNLVFAIAASPLIMTEEIHVRVLQTIHKQLRSNHFKVNLCGKHWEEIGFQGSDPSTDLRGVGFWGLMNLLYLLTCPETLTLARKIYKLSQDENQHFPFAVMSINISAIVLKVLREEKINAICNHYQQFVEVANELYVALFRLLFIKWKSGYKTISHSGFVLKDLESYLYKHPKRLLLDLRNYIMVEKSKRKV